MEHVFTLNEYRKIDEEFDVIRKTEKTHLFAPSKDSLVFILQFAVAYHVEKDLSLSSLSGIILN